MMNKIRLPLLRGVIIVVAGLLLIPATAAANGRYSDLASVRQRAEQLRQSSPGLVKVHKLAVTPGGREMLMLEIGSKGSAVPAILVGANMSGITPLATEAALSLASRVVADASLNSSLTWYIIPVGNPDAHERFFRRPLWSDPGNSRPFNEDLDDQTDEDGYNDLDGDGYITQMRVRSNDGIWIPAEDEPRLMRRADPAKGEKGIYTLYSEGIDDDGDGLYNEDPPGGTNINASFPHLFKYFDPRSGLYPGSEPETFAIMQFAFAHPEIAMVLAFGESNYLLSPPKSDRRGSFDTQNIRVPRSAAGQLGLDPSRTYTMEEIMEQVKPMMPAGMQPDENMIAGMLGMGMVVSPLPEDMKFYNEISAEYKEYLRKRGAAGERLEPAQPDNGSFEQWGYYHLGRPVFTMDLWGVPVMKEERSEGGTTTAGEAVTPAAATGMGRTPQEASGMGRAPQEASGMGRVPQAGGDTRGDARERALLAYSDSQLNGKGFVPWKSYNHPQLGEVEIGGFVPFMDNTPPENMVDSLLDLHLPFLSELVKKLPSLKIGDVTVSSKGGGLYQVEAWVTNEGYLPFTIAMGRRNRIPPPAIVTLEGDGYEILSGKRRTPIENVGGVSSVRLVWLIHSTKKNSLTLRLETKQAGNDSKRITIGG